MFGQWYKQLISLIYFVIQFFSPKRDEVWSHLPEDLIIEILLRLPVRSLHQFKCICKSWKILISGPQFANLRISTVERSLARQRLFFSLMSEPYKLFYYPLKPLFENLSPPVIIRGTMKSKYDIIGSCNGLLCRYYKNQHCVKLHNPFIRFKSKKSPKAVSHEWKTKQCGFGYDEVNDKYKVLLVMQYGNDPSQTLTKIYTFGDNSWKTIQNFRRTSNRPFSLIGQYVSGTLNWIVKKKGGCPNQSVILSFGFEKETYKELLLPQDDGNKVHGHILYVLNNCLGVCHVSNETHWVAWLMKECGAVESWTKIMIIPYDKFNKQPSYPLFISENGVVLLMNIYTTQFVLYDFNSGQVINSLKSSNTFKHNVHICCESLVTVPW